jgi:hypothetical protein
MTSFFYRQLEPCASSRLPVRPALAAKGNGLPFIPREPSDKSAPHRVLEHETQAAFLKALIAYEDGEGSRQLRASLARADRESTRIRHALWLMLTLFIVSAAGLGYCAVLRPNVFSDPTHFVTLSLSVLGLASLICQVEFVGYLLWHRFAVSHLYKECRQRVLLLVESRLRASLRRSESAERCQGWDAP